MTLNFLYIAIFWTLVLDVLDFYTDFLGQILNFIYRKDPRGCPSVPRFKPFCCSTCMTFWTCLALLFISGHVSILGLLACVVAGYSTTYILSLISLI